MKSLRKNTPTFIKTPKPDLESDFSVFMLVIQVFYHKNLLNTGEIIDNLN